MSKVQLQKIVTKRKKRVGRGMGSGKGSHTSGRGQKGQTSRAGYHKKRGFEGGQVPLVKRTPRAKKIMGIVRDKGFIAVRISKLISANILEIDNAKLMSFTKKERVKIVGDLNVESSQLKSVKIKSGVLISGSLKEAIIKSGGIVE